MFNLSPFLSGSPNLISESQFSVEEPAAEKTFVVGFKGNYRKLRFGEFILMCNFAKLPSFTTFLDTNTSINTRSILF